MSSEYSFWRSMMRGFSTVSNDNVIPLPVKAVQESNMPMIYAVRGGTGVIYHTSGSKAELKRLLIDIANIIADFDDE